MSLGPFGTVMGVQLAAAFQSPENGSARQVALPASLPWTIRKNAQADKSGTNTDDFELGRDVFIGVGLSERLGVYHGSALEITDISFVASHEALYGEAEASSSSFLLVRFFRRKCD